MLVINSIKLKDHDLTNIFLTRIISNDRIILLPNVDKLGAKGLNLTRSKTANELKRCFYI